MIATSRAREALNEAAAERLPTDSREQLRHKNRQLRGLRVCHLSPMERADDRAFTRECLPVMEYGMVASIIGPHAVRGYSHRVEFLPIPKSRNRAARIFFASRAVVPALRQNADVYHVHSPEYILPGLILKLLFRKKVVYDTREDFPAMMLTKAYLPVRVRKIAQKLTFAAERVAARYFDGFITADSGTLRSYANTGKSKKLVFYNLPNLQFYPQPRDQKKTFDLVYRGGLSERTGTFVLLDAVKLLIDQGIALKLLMFGYTDNDAVQRSIAEYIQELGLERQVTLLGFVRQVDMATTLCQARIAVCPLQRIPKFLNNIPVKVFESWACGLPVVASDLPPIRPFFPRHQRGLLFEPDDTQQLAHILKQLLANPQQIERIGRESRHAVAQRYNNSVEVQKLLRFYRTVMAV